MPFLPETAGFSSVIWLWAVQPWEKHGKMMAVMDVRPFKIWCDRV
jgi:hypothetical protein